jgi:hypothetical protein
MISIEATLIGDARKNEQLIAGCVAARTALK